jgi:hypothetical protein
MPVTRRTLLISLAGVGLAGAGLAGCQVHPGAPRRDDPSFQNLPRLRLDVAQVRIEERNRPTGRTVDDQLPLSTTQAARLWANQRLEAVGRSGVAVFAIHEAQVRETELARTTSGIRGAFTKEQTHKYDGVLDVTLEIRDAAGVRLSAAAARVTRSNTLREDMSLAQRDRLIADLVAGLVTDMNGQLETAMRQYLGPTLRS